MANVLDIRRRIKSVKNTQQITRAMKFVAAARLRKSQERMFAARPYSRQMLHVLNSLATRVDPGLHPLLRQRPDISIEAIVITGDKGLCGAFNTNIIKTSLEFLESKAAAQKTLRLMLIGKKGRDYFKRRPYGIRGELINVMDKVSHAHAVTIGEGVIHAFMTGEVDAVFVIYNEFKSVLQQRLVVEQLLPIKRLELDSTHDGTRGYIYEQPPEDILDDLLPGHVIFQLFHAMLESNAAEQAARMTAMDAATNNAGEMIDQLTLTMNRIRQASITREIIEVVSGASALS